MKLGDLVLTLGSSSSSSSSTTAAEFRGLISHHFLCDVDFEPHDIIRTTDGNYLVVGHVDWEHAAAIKFNESEIIWSKVYKEFMWRTEGGYGFIHRVIELDDNYYFFGSAMNNDESWCDSGTVVKTDFNGNIIWDKMIYDGWADGFCGDIVESHDSTAVVCFYNWYDGQGSLTYDYSPLLLKINKADGSLVWCKGYKADGDCGYLSLDKTADGYITSFGNYEYDSEITNAWWVPYVVKLDANGNKVWYKKYYRSAGNQSDGSSSVKTTADGGFILLIDGAELQPAPEGQYYVPVVEYDVLILKCDSNGDIQWCMRVHDADLYSGYEEDPQASIIVLDDGYVFTCVDRNTDLVNVIKLNLNGTYSWGKSINPLNVQGYIVDELWNPRLSKTEDSLLIIGSTSDYKNSYSSLMVEIGFDGSCGDCPYVTDGIATTLVDYTASMTVRTSYMYTKDFDKHLINAKLEAFDTALEHVVVCDRTYFVPTE